MSHGVAAVHQDKDTYETHLLCRCGFDAHAFGLDGVELVKVQHAEHRAAEAAADARDGSAEGVNR